jgi:hypothetical protein
MSPRILGVNYFFNMTKVVGFFDKQYPREEYTSNKDYFTILAIMS